MKNLAVLFITLFVLVPNAFADISAEKYCELTVQDLKNRVENLKEQTASYTANKDDQRALIQNEYKIKQSLKKQREELYPSYGISGQDYVLYMGKHKKAVKKYLRDNPEIKKEIDRLSKQIRNLKRDYENAKEAEDEEDNEIKVTSTK